MAECCFHEFHFLFLAVNVMSQLTLFVELHKISIQLVNSYYLELK